VLRSGARIGDIVAVSGPLGLAAAGLALLFEHAVTDGIPDAAAAATVRSTHPVPIAAQLAPRPPISDGPVAAIAGATAMLDLSDGLVLDARRVARASAVVIALDSASVLAISPDRALRIALDGGEDHSLFATFPPGTALPGGFRPIGVVVEARLDAQPGDVVLDGALYRADGGWDPYTDWSGGRG
jgi:thiamine-monophosphate kinase